MLVPVEVQSIWGINRSSKYMACGDAEPGREQLEHRDRHY